MRVSYSIMSVHLSLVLVLDLLIYERHFHVMDLDIFINLEVSVNLC